MGIPSAGEKGNSIGKGFISFTSKREQGQGTKNTIQTKIDIRGGEESQ